MTLNKTKIIATLGPSSTEKPILKTLIENGVNVFRVNFSHANHDEVKNTVSCKFIKCDSSNIKIRVP